jgi:hypothetical protein
MFFFGGEFSHFLNLKNMISKDIQRGFVKKIGPKFARFLKPVFQQVPKIEMDSLKFLLSYLIYIAKFQ